MKVSDTAKIHPDLRRRPLRLTLCLLCWLCLCGQVQASSIQAAVDQYYAGYPQKAVQMLIPIAEAGDVDAQYLLGNLLYTLESQTPALVLGDPVKWYRLAAAQDSAAANFALGALFNNRWLEYREPGDALLADSYFRRAQALGESAATVALAKLTKSRNTASLTYDNDSFNRDTQTAEQRSDGNASKPRPRQLADALTGFSRSGDPLVDAKQLQQLLGGAGDSQVTTPDLSTLQGMLGNFESLGSLLTDLMKAYQYIDIASELPARPGAN